MTRGLLWRMHRSSGFLLTSHFRARRLARNSALVAYPWQTAFSSSPHSLLVDFAFLAASDLERFTSSKFTLPIAYNVFRSIVLFAGLPLGGRFWFWSGVLPLANPFIGSTRRLRFAPNLQPKRFVFKWWLLALADSYSDSAPWGFKRTRRVVTGSKILSLFHNNFPAR